jgi:hypothetical protein
VSIGEARLFAEDSDQLPQCVRECMVVAAGFGRHAGVEQRVYSILVVMGK